jgi:signal transduction histidine kinase
MQQLSLINLRLGRAREPDREASARTRDLDAAARVVEAAMLEARQAIVALRTGSVAWAEFAVTLAIFANEFADNHEVMVEVAVAGEATMVDAGLQAEVLRILHEACSNAIRHGGAARIAVTVAADNEWLALDVRDDGCGFDPQQARYGPGVGLRSFAERSARRGGSLRIDSAPGCGATVRLRLPLAARARQTP